MTNPTLAPQSDEYQQIHNGIIRLVDTARTETVRSINAIMTATYWEIGRRIVEFEQGGEARAAYGTQLIERLSVDLSQRYKRGFSTRNLWQIRTFYLCFQHIEIPQTLSAESSNLIPLAKTFPLPWSAYVRLLSVKIPMPALFTRKRRYVTAGPYGSSTGKSPLNFTNERYCPTTNPPCCSSLHPPSQTFCRSKPYATRSFWNFLT